MANFHLAQKRQNGSVFSFCHAIMFLFREGKKSFLQKNILPVLIADYYCRLAEGNQSFFMALS
jgi:hypothetical protein